MTMWFKRQTQAAQSQTNPYLGPPQRAAARQEPVFDSSPTPNTSHPNTPNTVDIDSTPLFLAQKPESTAPAQKPVQFQHKVANQSHNTPANIVAKKQTPAAHNGSAPTPADIFTIPADVTIEGAVQTTKNITVAGTLKGDITSAPQLLLLPDSKMIGEITCETAEISGHVIGNITVSGLLVCRNTSHIEGNISYGALRVEQGAKLNGTLTPISALAE